MKIKVFNSWNHLELQHYIICTRLLYLENFNLQPISGGIIYNYGETVNNAIYFHETEIIHIFVNRINLDTDLSIYLLNQKNQTRSIYLAMRIRI